MQCSEKGGPFDVTIVANVNKYVMMYNKDAMTDRGGVDPDEHW